MYNIHTAPGIYKITCKANNRFYIGRSVNCSARLREHFRILIRGGHSNKELQEDFNKYSLENFDREVVEYCNIDELHNKEIYYINKYNATIEGYNKEVPIIIKNEEPVVGGNITIYSLHTKELLATTPGIKEAAILLKVSINRINNVITAHGRNQIKGILKDYIIIEEGYSLKECLINMEQTLKTRINNNIKLSKEEFSEKQRKNSFKSAKKSRKPVGKFDFKGNLLEEFSHAGAVCEKYPEFKYKGLYKCILGDKKSYKGFVWKYI
jgi:hypothetical protein